MASCARRKTTARDLQLQQRQLACDAPPPPNSLPCVAAPTPECRCCTCPRTAAPLPSPPCPAVPPAHPACTPVPPCPIKRSSRSFICAPKTAVLRHCCSMRAMSAWPASAAMSAAVLLSLQRALRGRRGQGDGVGWRGGGGGRGRGHARRLGCDVGARRNQQLHSFGVALVSCNHQWGAEQANGSEIIRVGAIRVPDEWLTRLKMGQEPSANAHSRGNSIHVSARRYQHAGDFSVAVLHSTK